MNHALALAAVLLLSIPLVFGGSSSFVLGGSAAPGSAALHSLAPGEVPSTPPAISTRVKREALAR